MESGSQRQTPGKKLTLLLLLGILAAIAAPPPPGNGPLDTDGDGLSDADESAIYHTNPNLADTDGDGATDGDEVKASTNPLDAGSAFRMVRAPQRTSEGHWRLTWQTVANQVYHLQRAANENPASSNWLTLASLTSTGTTASYVDPINLPRRFYRVMLNPVGQTNLIGSGMAQFLPLDGNQQPVEGGQISIQSDGTMAPFELRPAGYSAAGANEGFYLRFPNGARLVSGLAQTMQFDTLVAGFGSNSPFQLAQPLAVTNGPLRSLPVGDLDVAAIAALFGLPETNGLDVVLFGRFPLKLVAGVFRDDGLQGAQVMLRDMNLPLPAISADYPGFKMDLSPKNGLRLAFAGEFNLPDNSGRIPKVTIARDRPLWLDLKPTGDIRLGGRAAIEFPQGPKFGVDFGFDEPNYHLALNAGNLHAGLLDSLTDLLPPAPSAPASTDAATLDAARARLGCFQKAIGNFSAATVGLAPPGMDSRTEAPAEAFATATSVLNAWGFTAECGNQIPGAGLLQALSHAGRQAVAQSDLKAVLEQHCALMRIRKAQILGGLQLDASQQQELDQALAAATAAIIARAQLTDAVASLENMKAIMRCLLEIEQDRQMLGLPVDAQLNGALQNLLKRFTEGHITGLGVTNGVFSLASPRIAGLSRFAAMEELRSLGETLSLAQSLGLDGEITAPTGEAIGQLGWRIWTILSANLLQAEANGDYAAFTDALEDALEFIALRQSGIFPDHPDLAGLPGADALTSYAARLETVLLADLNRPALERSLGNLRRDTERLTKIMRQLPANFTYSPAPIQRAYERLEAKIAASFNVISLLSPADLNLVLAAGIAQEEMRARFNLPAVVAWETTRLPELVTRIGTRAAQSNTWHEVDAAMTLLLREADRLATNNQAASRRIYLQQGAALAVTARAVAVALWQKEKNFRNSNPLLYAADMILPGDVYVDRLAGSVRFNRRDRFLAGAFSGQLRLPKFNLSLTVDNASLTSGGVFDLNAYGQLGLGTTANSLGTLAIPARRPLKISLSADRHLSVAGGTRLALNNGMTFEAYLALDDPTYEFGLSASGLRFDLATNVMGFIPVIDTTRLAQLGPDVRLALNQYLASMSATAESLSELADASQFAPLGEPPDFSESVFTLSTDPLNAAANGLIIVLVAPAALGYVAADATVSQIQAATTPVVQALVRDIQRELGRARRDLDKARDELATAAAENRAAARRTLIHKMDEAGKTLIKVAEASQKVTAKQQAGALGSEGTDPAQTPEAAAARQATRQAVEAATAEPPSQVDPDTEIALMSSMADYLASEQMMGASTPDFDVYVRHQVNERRPMYLAQYGMGPDGTITNAAVFNQLTEAELVIVLEGTTKFTAVAMAANDPAALDVMQQVARTTLVRRMMLNGDKLKQARQARYVVPGSDGADVDGLRQEAEWPYQMQALELMAQFQTFGVDNANLPAGYDGTPGSVNVAAEYLRLLGDMTANLGKRAGYQEPTSPLYDRNYVVHVRQRDLQTRLAAMKAREQAEALKQAKANPAVPPTQAAALQAAMNRAAGQMFEEVRAWAGASPTLQFNLKSAVSLGRELVGLGRLLEEAGESSGPGVRGLVQNNLNANITQLEAFKLEIFPKYTARVTALADAQKAWWICARVNEVLLEGIAGKASNDLSLIEQAAFQSAQNTLALGGEIMAALREDVRLRNRPVELQLPGDVVVERISGSVYYRRDTGYLRGTFGGRLEFPDLQNAFFEISNATLDNQLNFSIAAATAGPLPFDGVRIQASVQATGAVNRALAFMGQGTMTFSNGPDLNVMMGFNTDTRTLSFDTLATDLQAWRMTDDLVLFDAGFGFTVRPQSQSGQLRATGSAGFFARAALATNRPPHRTNFHLYAEHITATADFQPGRVDLVFSNGTLHLPTNFTAGLCPNTPANFGPSVSLNPLHPIRAYFLEQGNGGMPEVGFSGELDFHNIGVRVPDLPGLAAELCTARLLFSSRDMPVFTNINGQAHIPLPRGQTSRVDILNGAWRVDGFPSGKIALANDVVLLNAGGTVFKLLGAGNATCPLGNAFTAFPAAPGQLPRIRLDGAVEVTLPAHLLTSVTGDVARATACGALDWDLNDLPQLTLDTVAFVGSFHLGGANGLVLTNGSLTLRNLQNAFDDRVNPPNPFSIELGGLILIPNGPGFGLRDTKFVFNNLNPQAIGLPQFVPGTMIYDQHQWELANLIPFQIRHAELTFRKGDLPIEQLLQPTNIVVTISARLEVPPQEPVFRGEVNDMRVTFEADGTPVIGLQSVRMSLDPGLVMTPISDIHGDLFIGGLDQNPPNPFFTGRVGGTYQTYKLDFLMAFTLTGPVGFCLDVNLGAAGVPLGPTGFLWTGANGGYHFLNEFGDPCEFTAYVDPATGRPKSTPSPNLPPVPAPKMTWSAFRDFLTRAQQQAEAFAQSLPGQGNLVRTALSNAAPPAASGPVNEFNIPCPDDCPPPTVNILCMPHPNQEKYPGKIILKFSSIDEPTLNNVFGITQQRIQDLKNQGVGLASNLASIIRIKVSETLPTADSAIFGVAAAERLNQFRQQSLDMLEQGFIEIFTAAINEQQGAEAIYNLVRDLAEGGLPCPDVTFKVGGTFSYTGISAFANVTGEGTIGTTGSGGVAGKLNVLGVPMGRAKLFVSATDAQGLPNPSICGDVNVSLGPLELGTLRAQMRCDGCITEMIGSFGSFVLGLSRVTLDHILTRVAPEHVGRDASSLATLLNNQQKIAFLGELMQLPAELVPPGLKEMFINALGDGWSRLNPELRLCGEVSPKIFGIPLAGELAGVAAYANKTNIIAVGTGSPAAMLAEVLGRTGVGYPAAVALSLYSTFAQEQMMFGYSVSWPDPGDLLLAGLDGRLRSPEAIANYLDESFDYVTENAIYTFSYSLSPMGLKSFNAQARVVMPNFTAHPAHTGAWVRPEDRVPALPSRLELLLSALTNSLGGSSAGLIADPNWKGRANDLFLAFPDGSTQRSNVTGLSFADDYFPHGGILGGAYLGVPRALYDAPPAELSTALNPNATPLDRLLSSITYVQEYVLAMQPAGALGFYLPAPNPPSLTDTNGQPLSKRALLESINRFDFRGINPGPPYAIEEMFVTGWLEGKLLGVPVARARLDVVPPDLDQGRPALFRAVAQVPPNQWLSDFTDGAALVFEMTQAPTNSIERHFTLLLERLYQQLGAATNDAQMAAAADQFAAEITASLPKVKLEAALTNFHFPAVWSPYVSANAAFTLAAYSPRFEPGYLPGNQSPLVRARRDGGLAFQGNARFKAGPVTLVDIPNAEFSVLPKEQGLPAISAQLNAPVIPYDIFTLRNVLIDFATDPSPRFSAAGELDVFAMGSFQCLPSSGSMLGGRLSVLESNGQPAISISVNPVRLALPSLTGDTLLVHGTTRNDPFTFSTTGPWTASLEFTNELNLLNLVRLGAGGLFSPLTLNGVGTSSASFTVGFGPSASVTLFPGRGALERAVVLQAGVNGSLQVTSDGKFLLAGQLGGDGLSFNGIAVPAGASFQVNNGGVQFAWSAGGVSGSLGLSSDGTPTFNGEAELPPLNFGIFRLAGADGGNLRGGFNNDGFAVNSGVKLTLLADWLQNQSLTLQSFTASNNGALRVRVTSPGNTLFFAGYPFDLTGFTFNRNPTNGGDGIATLTVEGALRAAPTFPGFSSISFTGTVTSAGMVNMRAGSPVTMLFGFPVRNLSSALDVSSAQPAASMSMAFSLGNGAGLWALLGTNWFAGNLSVDGSFSFAASGSTVTYAGYGLSNAVFSFARLGAGQAPQVRLEGDLLLPGFNGLRLAGNYQSDGSAVMTPMPPAPAVPLPYPSFNGSVAMILNQSGLSASGLLHVPPMPPVSVTGNITNNGGFRLSGSLGSTNIAGFSFTGGTVVLDRPAGGTVSVVLSNASITVPGLPGTHIVNGLFTNNGTFRLSGTVNSPSFSGLPVPGISGAANLVFSQDGLSLSGDLSAASGVLASVAPQGSLFGSIQVDSDGSLQLTASLSILPLTNGSFTITPASGANFDVTLDSRGLHLPAGALLKYGTDFAAPLPLPEIVLNTNGNFSITVGEPLPLAFTWRQFGLTQARFTFERVGQTLRIPSFNGQINVPKLERLAQLSGSLTNDGSFRLTGVLGTSVNLSAITPALPVAGLLNGGLTFSQSGLVATGALSGGILDRLNLSAAASGSLTITPVAVTLGGSVVLQPIQVGAVRIESTAVGGAITASWTANALRCPANLRLLFNNETLVNGSLPAFSLNSDGTFNLSGSLSGYSVAGFNLSGGSFQVSRTVNSATISLNNSTLQIPGFTTAFNVGMSGSLAGDGAFSLANAAAIVGSYSPAGSLPVNFSAASAVNLDNNSLRVTGTFSGGALGSINTGITASGTLQVQTNGTITPSASFAMAEFLLADKVNGFHLAPLSGGNFQVSVDGAGVRWPAGARLFYRNTALGTFALPAFTVAANGNFSLTTSAVEFVLDGFTLNGSLTLARAGGVTMLAVNAGNNLRLPGLNASVGVTGAATNNGAYRIAGSTSGNLNLPAGFPIAAFSSGASAVLQRSAGVSSLAVIGTVNGGCLGGAGTDDLRPVTATAQLGVAANGTLTLGGSLTLQPISIGVFTIEGPSNGANLTANLNNSFLQITSSRLRVTLAGVLDRNITLPAINVPVSGQWIVPVSLANLGVKGFPFTNVTCQLIRHAPDFLGANDLSLGNFAGNLGLSGFGQRFAGGTLFSTGSPAFDWEGGLTLAGFTATKGYLRLRNTGLSAGGSFNLTASSHTFHAGLGFSGNIYTDATFSLTGTGILSIDNLEVLSASYTFTQNGITGSPTLKFGDPDKLSWTPGNFTLSAATGVSFSSSINWNQNLSIFNSANIAGLALSASLNSTSGGGGFEVRLGGNITVVGNQQSFNQTLGSNLEFRRNFPPPLGPCVDFDLAPLRAKDCNFNWP